MLVPGIVKKALPIWTKYKEWASDQGKDVENNVNAYPGAVFIYRNTDGQAPTQIAVIIGVLGTPLVKEESYAVATLDPRFLSVHFNAVPYSALGIKFGRTAITFKQNIPKKNVLTNKHYQTFYTRMREMDWRQPTQHSLHVCDPTLFEEMYHYAGIIQDKDFILTVLSDAHKRANTLYHNNGTSFLLDSEFDDLDLRLNLKSKDNVGSTPAGKKTLLPSVMGSLDKVKTREELTSWLRKLKSKNEKLVVTPKMDGISLQLRYENGALNGAWTRGDGIYGKDVLNHVKAIPDNLIPKRIKYLTKLLVRAELIMDLNTFKSYDKQTNDNGFSNPRNMIAGVFNRKDTDKAILADVNVFAFDLLGSSLSKVKQLTLLKQFGFSTVPHIITTVGSNGSLDEDIFIRLAKANKWLSSFEYDGLVFEFESSSIREELSTERSGNNPAYSRAYKPDSANKNVQTKVRTVEWSVSKHGLLKPVITVDPVKLSGAMVSRATGFNAAYIADNKIGPGTIVTLTRSGDVIPYIVSVDRPTKASLPSVDQFGEWEWNNTNVDIVLSSDDNEDLKLQKLLHFFTAAGIENFSIGLITKFYKAGYTTTEKILDMTAEQMVRDVPGVQIKSATSIVAEFDKKLVDIPLDRLMYMSGLFGRSFGQTKLKAICSRYKKDAVFGWTGFSLRNIAEEIGQLPGFSYESGMQFARGIKPFLKFLGSHKDLLSYSDKQPKVKNNVSVHVVFSGFRDANLENAITSNGGQVSNSLTANSILIVKDTSSTSSKTQKAKELGVPIMTKNQFLTKYKLDM